MTTTLAFSAYVQTRQLGFAAARMRCASLSATRADPLVSEAVAVWRSATGDHVPAVMQGSGDAGAQRGAAAPASPMLSPGTGWRSPQSEITR
jgi:hypothetical protein